jgi:hypothetical protein
MRLTSKEISIIKSTLLCHCQTGIVYLHGSRINDTAKGRDIDLFFIVEDSAIQNLNKLYIQAELSRKFNEQKIDLLVLSTSDSIENKFYLNSKKEIL